MSFDSDVVPPDSSIVVTSAGSGRRRVERRQRPPATARRAASTATRWPGRRRRRRRTPCAARARAARAPAPSRGSRSRLIVSGMTYAAAPDARRKCATSVCRCARSAVTGIAPMRTSAKIRVDELRNVRQLDAPRGRAARCPRRPARAHVARPPRPARNSVMRRSPATSAVCPGARRIGRGDHVPHRDALPTAACAVALREVGGPGRAACQHRGLRRPDQTRGQPCARGSSITETGNRRTCRGDDPRPQKRRPRDPPAAFGHLRAPEFGRPALPHAATGTALRDAHRHVDLAAVALDQQRDRLAGLVDLRLQLVDGVDPVADPRRRSGRPAARPRAPPRRPPSRPRDP